MTGPRQPIELRLLGELEVANAADEAGPRLARRTKRLALLAYLVLKPGLHRRDTLLPVLWPETGETSARRALRQSLYSIGETLGEDVFRKRGEEIGVDEAALWCDATALQAAFEAGDYETVAELYRGELLAGFHLDGATRDFEDAIDLARQRIERMGREALRHLAERAESPEAAARYARRALSLEPCDESAVRCLIEALGRQGDRPAAIRAYEAFAERLRSEYRTEPSPETRAAIRVVRDRARPVAPPPREGLPDTLPKPLTSFVGRAREIEQALGLLERPDVRILTLIGPGGMGKSRTAIEIARRVRNRYTDGVVYARFEAYGDVDAALAALARAAGAELRSEREAPFALRDRLLGRTALVVLDGVDRVPELGLAVAEILPDTPEVDVLVTSRTPIRHSAEHRLPVPPLSLPEPGRHMGIDLPLESEAVALFLDRARRVDLRFSITSANVQSVVEICRYLDGLPLAIELAASRVGHLPVEEIVRRTEADAAFLHDGARDRPDRHETLAETIRWTSDRLDEEERALFHGLGAFAEDFHLDVLEGVWPELGLSDRPVVDLLGALIDCALVQTVETETGETRYRLLRTIRDHAARALEGDERRRLWEEGIARWYADWTRIGSSNWCTPAERKWLAALDRERVNLGAVLDRTTESDPGQAAEIAASIYYWWNVRGLKDEGRRRIRRILESNGALDPALRARLLVSGGQLAGDTEQRIAAVEAMREAESIYREIGDRHRLGWTLQSLGNVLLVRGEFEEATACLEEALALGEETDNALRVDACRYELAVIARLRGDLERARQMGEEALAGARRTGTTSREARSLIALALVELDGGDAALAERRAREALALGEEYGHANTTAYASWVLADALRARGRTDGSTRRLYARAIELYRESGNEEGMCVVVVALAESALQEGKDGLAIRLLGGVVDYVESAHLVEQLLVPRLEAAVATVVGRLGEDAFAHERATLAGVSLERILQWAGEIVPTVELRQAAP